MRMLHLGCGQVYLAGWVNVDLDSPKADLKCDLRRSLPCANNSVDFVHSEHLIEHLTIQEGLGLMGELYRVLKPGGVLRIATPDLGYILLRYFLFWKRQDWIRRYRYEWMRTRAEMVNICMREWGHQYLYDEEELKRRLREAGFRQISRQKQSQSKYSQLQNRETRKDSKLVVEAIK